MSVVGAWGVQEEKNVRVRTGGTECTSQRVSKNRHCQHVCLNRRRICRFAGNVGFCPRSARYILYPMYPLSECN